MSTATDHESWETVLTVQAEVMMLKCVICWTHQTVETVSTGLQTSLWRQMHIFIFLSIWSVTKFKLVTSSNVQFNKKFNVISSKEGRYSKIVSTKYDSRNEAIAFQMQSEDNKIMKNGWLAGLASNTKHSGISCDQYFDHSYINTVQKWQQFI